MGIITRQFLRLHTIEQVGSGIYIVSFEIKPKDNKFLPGQFMHLALDEFDPSLGFWPESRVFSLASQPRSDRLTIVYSVKGEFTHRMKNELKEGNSYWVKFPYGDFTVQTDSLYSDGAVFITGGTGISPFIPFYRSLSQSNENINIHHHHGIKSDKLRIFTDVLASVAEVKGFRGFEYLESSTVNSAVENWELNLGIISLEKVLNSCKAMESAKIYISGPPQMISYFRSSLVENKISPERIVVDSWE